MITNVAITKLYPHPQNPRKDLGDLTELAESIKSQGILQNLTVVPQKPGYCLSCNLYNGAAGKCTDGHDKSERPPCSKWESRDCFTVVIGHRRLAAATLAGLNELPCVITEMDERTQIATMLLENMQRNDLTVYEQAQGFQMMLDLGETVHNISEKTGFSETTVRRRINLLELDHDKFKKSEARGATLMDYAELEKIEDIARKNDVLDKIGTDNFKNALKQAIDTEKREKRVAVYREALGAFATEINDTTGYRYVASYSSYSNEEVKRPDDADTVEYFFRDSGYGSFYLYADKKEPEIMEDPEAKKRRERKEWRSAQLKEATERAFSLRKDFIRGISNAAAKKHIAELIGFTVAAIDESYFDSKLFAELLGIEPDAEDVITADIIAAGAQKTPERALLYMAYCSAGDGKEEGYYRKWNLEYDENPNLDALYELLEKFGYGMSDEEKTLQNGTHTLFSDTDTDEDANAEPEDPCALCKAAHPSCDECCAECDDRCNGGQVCRRQTDEDTEDDSDGA